MRLERAFHEQFFVRPALNNRTGAISFEARILPRNYLRCYTAWVCYLQPSDKSVPFFDEVSFYPRLNRFYPGYMAFESTKNGNYYLRAKNDYLVMEGLDNSAGYRDDASWKYYGKYKEICRLQFVLE